MRAIAYLIAMAVACLSVWAADEKGAGWWGWQPVNYKVVEGIAVVQGDIQIGTPEEVATPRPDAIRVAGIQGRHAIFVADPASRWPGGIVPYTISGDMTGLLRQRIQEAIDEFTTKTPIRWVPRTNQANYVQFSTLPPDVNECGDSAVGMKGGAQSIRLSTSENCGLTDAGVVHEMSHSIGKEHEQLRFDRDFYISIKYDNLDKLFFDQYDTRLGNTSGRMRGFDLLPYDYGSIMHYSDTAERKSANTTTIETIPLGIPIREGGGFSANDLESIRQVYGGAPPATTTITSHPRGLGIVVDGVSLTAPQMFNWADGSRHTVSVAPNPQSDPTAPAVLRYVFGRWSNDAAQSQTVTASPETRILTANFVAQYKVQAMVSSAGGGSVAISPPSADGFYPEGTRIVLTASPSAGFVFLRWDTLPGSLRSVQAGESDNPSRFTVLRDYGYRANFVPASSVITTIATNIPSGGLATATVVIDGVVRYLPIAFAWPPGSSHTLNVTDVVQPRGVSGVASRIVFQNWSTGPAASQTIAAPSSSAAITANWKRQFLVTAQPFDPGVGLNTPNGKIGVSPSATDCPGETFRGTGCYYDEGALIQATATAQPGFSFTGWTRDGAGTSSTIGLTVADQTVLQANFAVPGQLYRYGILNAANYGVNALAPGEIFTIFGHRLGPSAAVQVNPSNGVFPTSSASTRVLFDGIPAPLIYVSGSQISAVAPYSIASKTTTTMQIESNGTRGNAVTVPVGAADPALFTLGSAGSGQGAILNQDGSVNGAGNPATRGSVVVLFGTGEGATTPAGVDGKPAAAPYPKPNLPVTATLAGRSARVLYYGAAPGLIAGLSR